MIVICTLPTTTFTNYVCHSIISLNGASKEWKYAGSLLAMIQFILRFAKGYPNKCLWDYLAPDVVNNCDKDIQLNVFILRYMSKRSEVLPLLCIAWMKRFHFLSLIVRNVLGGKTGKG